MLTIMIRRPRDSHAEYASRLPRRADVVFGSRQHAAQVIAPRHDPMIFLDLVVAGPQGAAEAITGVIVGWAWSLAGWGGTRYGPARSLGRAPQWVKWFVSEGVLHRRPSGGVHVMPPRDHAEASNGYRWGSGHRLGNR